MKTKILVEKVEEGAVYQGSVYDYWVTCCLLNNSKIILFDYEPFDLTNCLNKNVTIKIKALFVEKGIKENLRNFQGEIVEQSNRYYFTNNFINIEVSKGDIENEKIELNKLNDYSFGRLDILSINELNDESPTT